MTREFGKKIRKELATCYAEIWAQKHKIVMLEKWLEEKQRETFALRKQLGNATTVN